MLMIVASIKAKSVKALHFEVLASNKSILPLKYLLYIYNLVHFKKNQATIKLLIHFVNKVNKITLVYTKKLDLWICKINVKI